MQFEVCQFCEFCILIVDCFYSMLVWIDFGYVVVWNQNIKSGRFDLSVLFFIDVEYFVYCV